MFEDNVPLLNLDNEQSDTETNSLNVEHFKALAQTEIVPNVVVRNANVKGHQEGLVVDYNIIQEECIDIENIQAVLLDLKYRRHEILQKGPTLPEGKETHIFVSYSSNDKAKVFPIIAELEQKHSLVCIFDDRDFQSGNKVLENINHSITISTKVLIFLSDNFNQSGYCKHENDLALIASLENGENMIIPVLLEECDVPRSLRPLTYIDASKCQTRQTIALEIYQAYITPENDDTFLRRITNTTNQGVMNGFYIDIKCRRDFNVCHMLGRPSREYIVLNEDACQQIENDKVQISDDLMQEVAGVINSHFEDGSCSSLHKCGFPLCFCILMYIISVAILLAIIRIYIVEITGKSPSNDAVNRDDSTEQWFLALLMAILPSACAVVMIIACFLRYKIRRNLRIIHYDVLTCERFLISLLKTDINFKDKEDIEEYAKERIVTLLNDWLYSDESFDSLPDAAETRHSVKGGKKCLCQLLEPHILHSKAKGDVTII